LIKIVYDETSDPCTYDESKIYEIYPEYISQPLSLNYGDYPIGELKITVDDIEAIDTYAPRNYYLTTTQFSKYTLNTYLPKWSDNVVTTYFRVLGLLGNPLQGAKITVMRNYDNGYEELRRGLR